MSTGIDQALTMLGALEGDDLDTEIANTEQRLSALRALRNGKKGSETKGQKRKGKSDASNSRPKSSRKSQPVGSPNGEEAATRSGTSAD